MTQRQPDPEAQAIIDDMLTEQYPHYNALNPGPNVSYLPAVHPWLFRYVIGCAVITILGAAAIVVYGWMH